jgi:sugar lactone lactonase YvrE
VKETLRFETQSEKSAVERRSRGEAVRFRLTLAVGAVIAALSFLLSPGKLLRSADSASLTTASSEYVVTTHAGIQVAGYADGTGVSARFYGPLGIAIDPEDHLIVADYRNLRIRRIDPNGKVTTLAGAGRGQTDGTGVFARFNNPSGVAVTRGGMILVADYGNHRIRSVTLAGETRTIAGSGTFGSQDGPARSASFANPSGITLDAAGNIYVLDAGTSLVRRIDPEGAVSTLAGRSVGYLDGTGPEAAFQFAGGAPQPSLDRLGNLIVPDFVNNRIRRVSQAGVVTTLAGGGSNLDGRALDASLASPSGVARDLDGNLLIADWNNSRIRKLDLTTMTLSTIAGTGTPGSLDGPGSSATFLRPAGIAVDSRGNIYVSDFGANNIRKISRGTSTPTPTPTPRPTPTPTPTPIPTPTPTPTPKPTPTPGPGSSLTPVQALINPGFETGDFSGWRLLTYYVGDGGAFIYTGQPGVTEGGYAAQFRASGRILVDSCAQDLRLPIGNYRVVCDVLPSLGTTVSLMVDFNDGSAPLRNVSVLSAMPSTLALDFSVQDPNRPLTLTARGDQRRYIRSNFIVDNFRLYRR